MTGVVTLKLRGPRQLDAADWMLGKPTPEEIDEDGREWECLGVKIRDGVLSIPAHLLAEFIEEIEDGIVTMNDIAAGVVDEDLKDAKATARALETIADKLRQLG